MVCAYGVTHDTRNVGSSHLVSVHETVGAVDLACAVGALAPDPAVRAQALALRVKRMLRALMLNARAG